MSGLGVFGFPWTQKWDLDHVAVAGLVAEKPPPWSPHWLQHFTPPPAAHQGSLLLVLVDVGVVFFSMVAVLTGVKRRLAVVLICFALVAGDAEHLFLCLSPSALLLGKHACSVLLPSFQSGSSGFWRSVVSAVCIFWMLTPYRSYHLQILSPIQ